MKTELLAPAKDKETAIAAIDCGADAVYIGGPQFGARSKAGNSIEDIREIVEYAHKFYAKVFVTVNTVLYDNELNKAKELIKQLYDIKVDALIIQDMAIIEAGIKGEIPPIPLHASTQCDNRDLEKIQFFEKIGLPRVVLARELSLDKIKEIRANTSVELECFIHGALCVSYSGQCYLSEFIGGRSANRGECAQPCRKKYTLIDDNENILVKDKHLLCLKDFNTSKHIKEMVDIGVNSYKIEGRLKDINYVKTVVLYYRRLLDKYSQKISSGEVITDFVPDVNKIFNRGYTNYFLKEREKCFNFDAPKGVLIGIVTKIGRNYFDIESKTELHPQDGLCIGKENGCLVNSVEGNRIFPNKMPEGIEIGQRVFRNKDVMYDKELQTAKIKRKIKAWVSIIDDRIISTDEDNNTVSIPLPKGQRANNQARMNEVFRNQFLKSGESDFVVKDVNINASVPFLPISVVNELRRISFAKLMDERKRNYVQDKQQPLCHHKYYKDKDDYHANVYNEEARAFYNECECHISDDNSPLELMRTKHCIKYALGMCKAPKKLFLVDEKGAKYPLKFDCRNCEMVILR